MKMTEEMLNEKNRELVDKGMEEIIKVTRPDDQQDIPEYRAKVILFAYEFKQPLKDVCRVLYCILSAGIIEDRVVPVLRLTLELAGAATISPALSGNILTYFINTGLMNIEKIGTELVSLSTVGRTFPTSEVIQPRSKGGSGQVGDTIDLARDILVYQRRP